MAVYSWRVDEQRMSKRFGPLEYAMVSFFMFMLWYVRMLHVVGDVLCRVLL